MLRRGDCVLCNFPFREASGAGPSSHIALCAATGHAGNVKFAIVFYTTTQIDYQGTRRPRQYLFVSEDKATRLGQKRAFLVDASRIARLPLTAAYFPEMEENTVRIHGRDPDFVTKVEERLRELIADRLEVTRADAVTRGSK